MATLAPPPPSLKTKQSSPIPSPLHKNQSLAFPTDHRNTISDNSRFPKLPLAVSGNTFVSSSVNSSSSKIVTKPVIDNYDSFTYNLCQYMGELKCDFQVYRNDELTVDDLERKNPRGILISPGPGTPQDSGISLETVLKLGSNVPIFGVCAWVCSALVKLLEEKLCDLYMELCTGRVPLYITMKVAKMACLQDCRTGRYHSLGIEKENFPSDVLEITARTEDGLAMAARHKVYRYLLGVQFHPESIITNEGKTIVHNFIKLMERMEAESA